MTAEYKKKGLMQPDNSKFVHKIVVRLFRIWSIKLEAMHSPFPAMTELCKAVRLPHEVATAAASLFELAEAQMGRRLRANSCASHGWTSDEQELIGLLEHSRGVNIRELHPDVPSGIPEPLAIAAASLRQYMGMPNDVPERPFAAKCSFVCATLLDQN